MLLVVQNHLLISPFYGYIIILLAMYSSLASFSVVLGMINLVTQQSVINQHICKLLHVQVEFKNALKLVWVLPGQRMIH